MLEFELFVRNARKEDAYGYGDEDFAKFLLVLYMYVFSIYTIHAATDFSRTGIMAINGLSTLLGGRMSTDFSGMWLKLQ